MTFGMKNAGNTFQHLMYRILFGLQFTFPYLNNIFICSRSEEEHRSHVAPVLQRLQDVGLSANAKKCKFSKPELAFLGHRVSAASIKPLPDWVQTITDLPAPTTAKELQNFLGVMNFYRCFLPSAPNTHGPLT